jgi:hypothetical protein
MKRILATLFAFFVVISAFSQQTTLAQWTFPSGNASDTLPDAATTPNATKALRTLGGVSAIEFKNGAATKAAQATKWDNGSGIKAWRVAVKTTGFSQIKISSKLTAGGSNPGPKDLKLQYRLGQGVWTDVANGTITVGNDWTTGVLANLPLPAECENQEAVELRWVMTSNLDINGNTLVSTGISKIDDIVITGQTISGIDEKELDQKVSVYPNPCNDQLILSGRKPIGKVELFSVTGSRVLRLVSNQSTLNIPVGALQPGRYFLLVEYDDHSAPQRESLIIR